MLDVVRGLALCGILFANIALQLGIDVPWTSPQQPPVSYTALHLLVQERFFPIFSLLFGVGFGILWQSAGRRSPHPRLVMLRRRLFLGLIGVPHQVLHPGEALLPYALCALVLLLPATFLPHRALIPGAAVLGAALLVPGVMAGGAPLIPGLLLLGFAAALAGLPAWSPTPARPESSPWWVRSRRSPSSCCSCSLRRRPGSHRSAPGRASPWPRPTSGSPLC
ncbi:hypothetical protein [Brachybacterium sillae]|uniref:hypothetical protein n=1 Tax=Brachybacterium sillae TaxID=2810536 RepID=UPI00217D9EFC|nr:hypothetical protein [Brachybacterium sillae]